jgi:hypothetical protein
VGIRPPVGFEHHKLAEDLNEVVLLIITTLVLLLKLVIS